MNQNKVINISKKTFINVVIILGALILFTTILTYVIPKGEFGSEIIDGVQIIKYDDYHRVNNIKGINIFKGIFAPFFVLLSSDNITLLMLSIFLLTISGCFQIMSDCGGMQVIVQKIIKRFNNNKKLLVSLIILIFMIFGSFFGLFEEVLTLFPIILILTLSLGYDSYTGFLICIVATGFGFASAITNPFTVIIASEIIGISPMANVWYRIIIFVAMYFLLVLFVLSHIKRIEKNKASSPTFASDQLKNIDKSYLDCKIDNKIFNAYVIFLSIVLVTIITVTSIPSLRDYTVVFLIAIFLFGGFIAGFISSDSSKKVFKSFINGVVSAFPAIILVLMASSIKYILIEGKILATITNAISTFIVGKNDFVVTLLILLIVLILEFFISSSTAKAIFVMGILACVSTTLSKELLVLIYVFGDGYTNVLFPTSPVLLISLSMTGLSYVKWLKKSKWLFLITLLLVIVFLAIALFIKY